MNTARVTPTSTPLPRRTPTEVSQLQALRSGCDDAYRKLVTEYGSRLLCTALNIVRDEEEARDCVQEALLSAFRSLHRFEGRSSLYSWLFRIVTNVALKRRQAAARFCSIDSTTASSLRAQALEDCSGQDCPATTLHQHRLSARVREAVERLPARHREIIGLRDLNGHDTATTAALLGISRSAAKVRLHRARGALRQLLDNSALRHDLEAWY